MCGSVIEDIGSGISDAFSGVGDVVDDALVGLDKTVGEAVPGGWTTVGAAALAAATMGGSLGATGALEAGAVASADATAAGLGFSSAAEAISAGAATAEMLGLPAAATVADLAAVSGSASAGWAGLGEAAGIAGGVASGASSALSPEVIAANLGFSDPIAAIAGGVSPAELGMTQAGTSLSNILGYAKTAAPIVGGLGKLMGGYQALQTGKQMQQYANQADPFSPYRPGYAGQLQNLMNNPNSVTQTPGYQFNLAQGLQGLQAQQAAQGRLVSGGALIQGQQFGQNLASQTYNDQVKTLMALSGASQSPATGAAAQAGLTASNLGSTYGGWQSIAGGLGQVANPLATLYSNYNNPSPNPSA